jgi:uncharacterized linocin/CFP29 family protein
MSEVKVMRLDSLEAQQELAGGSRPFVNRRTGHTMLRLPNGLTVNSTLRKDEWEELDRTVLQEAVKPLNVTQRLISLGLVKRLGSIGTLMAQYTKVSEVTAANRSLTGTTGGNKDLPDTDLAGVPVPVIFKEFEIPMRTLAASRRMGDGLDLTAAVAAARVVGESVEDLVLNGDTKLALNGNSIAGITTQANRNTDTATNYGGGDWGTITNVIPTISGMIAAAEGDNYFGPYGIFVATTQYGQAARAFFTDGSGDTPISRALRIPSLSFIEPAHWLADGVVVLINLTRDVIELATVDAYWPAVNMEWSSGDGMMTSYKVMSVMTPIVKATYGSRSGIVHATSA